VCVILKFEPAGLPLHVC